MLASKLRLDNKGLKLNSFNHSKYLLFSKNLIFLNGEIIKGLKE